MNGPLGPSQAADKAKAAVDELRLQFIAETVSRAERYSRILASAARRRDRRLLAVKLRQLALESSTTCRECAYWGGGRRDRRGVLRSASCLLARRLTTRDSTAPA